MVDHVHGVHHGVDVKGGRHFETERRVASFRGRSGPVLFQRRRSVGRSVGFVLLILQNPAYFPKRKQGAFQNFKLQSSRELSFCGHFVLRSSKRLVVQEFNPFIVCSTIFV